MPNEGFLQRWSRLKAEPVAPEAPAPVVPVSLAAAPPAPAPDAEPALPTLADAEALDAGSDYSAFVGRGVDSAVRRLAMKKLFADPHFNLIDGLDIYMGDYNVPDPVSAEMLASLTHARSALGRFDEAVDAIVGADPIAPDAITTEQPGAEAPATATDNQEAA